MQHIRRPSILNYSILVYPECSVALILALFFRRLRGSWLTRVMTVQNVIARLIQHIPDRSFHVIRSARFLSNRGKSLNVQKGQPFVAGVLTYEGGILVEIHRDS